MISLSLVKIIFCIWRGELGTLFPSHTMLLNESDCRTTISLLRVSLLRLNVEAGGSDMRPFSCFEWMLRTSQLDRRFLDVEIADGPASAPFLRFYVRGSDCEFVIQAS